MLNPTDEFHRDQEAINVWKIAPGSKARVWGECRRLKCITINWLNLNNYNDFRDKDAIKEALENSNEAKGKSAEYIWQFVHDIQQQDVVVANKGVSCVVGIGVVTSEYLPPDDPRNPNKTRTEHRHARLVDWVVNKTINVSDNLFGLRIPPTVLRLKPDQYDRIKEAYLQKYPELKETLDDLFAARHRSPPRSTVAEDVNETSRRTDIKSTTKKALIDARIGQGKFREEVLRLWGQCCAVTGSVTHEVIRASHIRPWSKSNDEQRLEPDNGIPLIASLDALFDAGLISFESSGRMIVSSRLNDDERKIFCLGEDSLIKTPTAETATYLRYHRTNIFE